MNRIAKWSIASLLLAAPAQADEVMQYQGKPVDALCIAHLLWDNDRSHTPSVELGECGRASMRGITVLNRSASSFTDQGFEGFEYMENDGGRASYAYYKDLGGLDGIRALWVEHSGGGSGRFSSLIWVVREGDSIRMEEVVAAGDRCSRGIVSAEMKEDELVYTQHLTPMDLLQLAEGTRLSYQAAQDLESSASSCFATGEFNGKEMVGVTLSTDETAYTDVEGWTDRFAYQSCFNSVMRGYVGEGKTKLDARGLKRFAQKFYAKCANVRAEVKKPQASKKKTAAKAKE